MVERLYSVVKNIMAEDRHQMNPSTLEMRLTQDAPAPVIGDKGQHDDVSCMMELLQALVFFCSTMIFYAMSKEII